MSIFGSKKQEDSEPKPRYVENGKVVVVGGKEVTVERLNLRRISKLLTAIDALPQEVVNDAKAGNEAFVSGIVEALPKIADIVCDVLKNQITPDELLEADFDEVFDLVEGFLEVNNVPKIMKRLGKVKTLATGAQNHPPKAPVRG